MDNFNEAIQQANMMNKFISSLDRPSETKIAKVQADASGTTVSIILTEIISKNWNTNKNLFRELDGETHTAKLVLSHINSTAETCLPKIKKGDMVFVIQDLNGGQWYCMQLLFDLSTFVQ